MAGGWAKIHKSILGQAWYSHPPMRGVAIHVILAAAYTTREWMGITLGRGQLITSTAALARELGFTPRQVRTALDNLEKTDFLRSETTNKFTIITITNYEIYQAVDFHGRSQTNDKPEVKQTTNSQPLPTPSNIEGSESSDWAESQTNDKQEVKQTTSRKRIKKLKSNTPPIIPPNSGDAAAATDWRNDYQAYLSDLRSEYRQAIADQAWMAQRQEYHPTLDIAKSLEKALVDYWATPQGWQQKKASRSKAVSWRRTLSNALTLSCNQVRRGYSQNQTNTQTPANYVF